MDLFAVIALPLAILCVIAWLRVFYSIDTSGDTVTGPDLRHLKHAAFSTALLIGFVALYLAAFLIADVI